ncbi:MAG TPA: type II toxin-antitoxin system antitoxin SocA domain-containing protein [Candidatus Limnocylindria bacterium]|nr:type II toxin-antitoxin system antitoxin SocA domain-containing protein [Candidatus Limnocylindria bacterium]
MVSVHDVAAYILRELGPMSAMKLQKLVYYAQAWSLVWDDRPLFPQQIEAWANGPVCPDLYERHRGEFLITAWPWGNANALDWSEQGTVNGVLNFYGRRDAQWLSDLTHRELPWRQARRGLPAGARSSATISHASMAEYYGGLDAAETP